jgi:hypothetical protein
MNECLCDFHIDSHPKIGILKTVLDNGSRPQLFDNHYGLTPVFGWCRETDSHSATNSIGDLAWVLRWYLGTANVTTYNMQITTGFPRASIIRK